VREYGDQFRLASTAKPAKRAPRRPSKTPQLL
jgi:hypothetical protein